MIGSLCTLTYHSVDTTFSHWLDAAGGLRRAQRVRTNTRADVGFCITLLLAGYSVGILPVLQTQCNFIDFLSGGVTMRAFEARNPSASSFRQLNGCLRVSFVSKASLKLWCPSNLLFYSDPEYIQQLSMIWKMNQVQCMCFVHDAFWLCVSHDEYIIYILYHSSYRHIYAILRCCVFPPRDFHHFRHRLRLFQRLTREESRLRITSPS